MPSRGRRKGNALPGMPKNMAPLGRDQWERLMLAMEESGVDVRRQCSLAGWIVRMSPTTKRPTKIEMLRKDARGRITRRIAIDG